MKTYGGMPTQQDHLQTLTMLVHSMKQLNTPSTVCVSVMSVCPQSLMAVFIRLLMPPFKVRKGYSIAFSLYSQLTPRLWWRYLYSCCVTRVKSVLMEPEIVTSSDCVVQTSVDMCVRTFKSLITYTSPAL